MKRPKLLNEEVLHYLNEEWNDSIGADKNGLWLTTRAFQIKLKDRGLLTTWPTLMIKLNQLLNVGDVEMVQTSCGICWKPSEDKLVI